MTANSLLDDLIDAFDERGYRHSSEPLALTLFGIRGADRKAGAWDDVIGAWWFTPDGEARLDLVCATVDPGRYYLQRPMNKLGTAILAATQHRRCWRRGFHKGEHAALVQASAMAVHRDGDLDEHLDMLSPPIGGWYGINLHSWYGSWEPQGDVGRWSAGCQVTRWREDLDRLLGHYDAHVAAGHDKRVDYTLLDAADGGLVERVHQIAVSQWVHRDP